MLKGEPFWHNLTHSLSFHPEENYVNCLRKGSASCGLINKIFGSQVDVVNRPDCQKNRRLVNFDMLRCRHSQNGLGKIMKLEPTNESKR